MPAFDELLTGISPETGYPDDFLDLARGAYEADTSSANAVIADLEGKLADALSQLQEQKVVNYDLMRAAAPVEESGDAGADSDQEDDGESAPESYDDLFKEDN